MNKKITFILLIFMLISIGVSEAQIQNYYFQSRGVLANSKVSREYVQPDGSVLTIYMHGDAVVNWATTSDGFTLLMNQQDGFEFAAKNSDGELELSGIIAQNPENRSFKTKSKLSNIEKNLTFSKEQVDYKVENHILLKNSKAGSLKGFPTTGTRKLIMILANFNNTTTTYTQTQFNNYMNQSNYNSTGSFKDYFFEASYGQLTVNTTVTAWVTLPNTHNYYGPEANWGEFAYDAVVAANSLVDYSQFDNDGDGVVDGVAIIHQGEGQEATSNTNDIWSHSWQLSSAGYTSAQRTFDGVKVDAYTTQPEKDGTSMATIGVMCHEFGHNLGGPDFYDTDYETGGEYDGTGDWDLQASGSYNGSPSGSKPAHPNAYTKCYIYGWATPTVLSSGQSVTVYNSSSQNTQSFYRYNTTTSNEYFLIENRQLVGFDSYLPGHGMIIYHVDGDYIVANDYEVNASSHQGMYPMAANSTTANGIMTYPSTINSGGCPWPGTGSKTSFTDATTPNSKSWAGANTSKPITAITENTTAKTITFNFMGGPTCTPPTGQATSFAASNLADNSMTIAWNRGNGNAVLVVARKGGAVNTDPTNSTTYTANAAFGSGTEIGTGNYVVYNGTGTSVNVTNLAAGTTYHYAIYEYASATYCYKTPALTGNALTTGIAPCTYCLPTSASDDDATGLTNVTFNSINNNSVGDSEYTDFTNISTSVTIGQSYTLSAKVNTAGAYTVNTKAWIDWNKNCTFDASEVYDLGNAYNVTNGISSLTPSITIPGTATVGTTIMRVRATYSIAPTACNDQDYSEAEDYTISVVAATAPPVANFSANNTTPTLGETVTFSDLSTNTPTSWAWSFNPTDVTYVGGTSATSQNPQVTFGTATAYSVTLTATNAYGNDSETKTAYINICGLGNIVTTGTWTLQATAFNTASRGISNISVVDANTVWALAYDGSGDDITIREFTKTTNGGTTWTPGTITGYNTYSPSMIFGVSSTTAYLVMYETDNAGGVLIKTTNGGTSWATSKTFNSSGFPNIVHFFDANNGVTMGDPVSSEFEIYTTTDGGTNWNTVAGANIPNPSGSTEYGIVGLYDAVGNTIWFTTNKGWVYKSTDKGLTWAKSQVLAVTNTVEMDIEMLDASNGFIHVSNYDSGNNLTGYTFYKTSDGGSTWTLVTRTGTVYDADLAKVPGTCNSYVQTGSNGTNGISYSTGGGTVWSNLNTPQVSAENVQLTAVEFYNSSLGWAGQFNESSTVGGIYKYTAAPIATITTTPGCGAGTGSVTITSSINGNQTFYLCNAGGTEIANFTTTGSSYTFTNRADGTYTGKVMYNGNTSDLSSSAILTNATTPVAPSSVTSYVPNTLAIRTTICEGESLSLEYSGGSGATFNWYSTSCGNGLVGSGQNFIVTPASSTTYYGRWENVCGSSACASVAITVIPTVQAPASVSASSTSICVGESITLSYTGGLGTNFNWYSTSCGTGLVGSGNDLSVSPSATTTYYGRWENSCGSSNCLSVTVNVDPVAVEPTTVVADDTEICQGESITLSYTGGTGGTFKWYSTNCGTGLVGTGNNLQVSPSTTTTYYGRWESSCGNSACKSVMITVNPVAIAPTNVSATATTICVGGATTLSYTAGSGTSFKWYSTSCGTGLVGTGNDFSVSPTTTTTYYGRWETVCNNSNCLSITINVEPIAIEPTSISASETELCEGESTTLSYIGGTGGTFKWYSTDCGTDLVGTGNDLNIAPTETTTYYGRWESSCGSTTCKSVIIEVTPLPTVTLAVFDDVCIDEPVFSLSGGLPEGGTYIGNGITNNQFDASIAGAGTSSVTYEYTEGYCTLSEMQDITVIDLPVVGFTYEIDGTEVTFTNTTTNALEYLWNFGDGIGFSTNYSPVYDYLVLGSYTVILTANNSACEDDFSDNILLETSVVELSGNSYLTIYPNPSNGKFSLVFNSDENADISIEIYSIDGKVIYENSFTSLTEGTEETFDLSNYSDGIYQIKIYCNDKITVKNLIIK